MTAWAVGGNVPDAIIRLTAAPAGLKPAFSFGCGSHDGSASCDLGAVDAKSAQRQLQATVIVAASATTVTSVRLTAVESAAHLSKDPQVSVATAVTAAAAAAATTTPTPTDSANSANSTNSANSGTLGTDTSPLTVGNLPDLSGASPIVSPGGNAAGLFPPLTPSGDPASGKSGAQNNGARTVSNSAALPLGAPVVGAQIIGLGVLALAFVLAVARLSLRRRPALSQAGRGGQGGQAGAASAAPPAPGTGPQDQSAGGAQPHDAGAPQNPAESSGDDAPDAQ